MCLILFAYKVHPDFNLVLCANRDEYYSRPTRPLGYWEDRDYILAGRDLKGGGTWLGVTRSGRVAAITNYRDPASQKEHVPSRGLLLTGFLSSRVHPFDYLDQIRKESACYNGFNLLVGDRDGLFYYANRGDGVMAIPPGIHGLSNHLLDTAWPKIRRGKEKFEAILCDGHSVTHERLFSILFDQTPAPVDELPDTGVGRRWEEILAPLFIVSPTYGTRSSSALTMSTSGRISLGERTFHSPSADLAATSTRTFHFSIIG